MINAEINWTVVSLHQIDLKTAPFFWSLAIHTFSNSDHVTWNASRCFQWQYILFYKQKTNDQEDTHANANPHLIYKNNQIKKMKFTQTVHKYIINNPQTQNVYQHGAHSLIILPQCYKPNHEPQAIVSYRGVIIGHFGNTSSQSKAASVK